jgi:hypothetical protein
MITFLIWGGFYCIFTGTDTDRALNLLCVIHGISGDTAGIAHAVSELSSRGLCYSDLHSLSALFVILRGLDEVGATLGRMTCSPFN